jgi:hypothetical protein
VAIDADYKGALEDLVKLQWRLKQDGVGPALEMSKRGGHLWVLMQSPAWPASAGSISVNLPPD